MIETRMRPGHDLLHMTATMQLRTGHGVDGSNCCVEGHVV